MPKKRKSISKRTRFEIFKRDQFTCQYCGGKPPAAVLWVDHILAVSNGGGNENENLATSCQACNQGKSSVPLGQVVQSLHEKLASEHERIAQMEIYNKWLKEIAAAREKDLLLVSDAIVLACGNKPEKTRLAGDWEQSVVYFLKLLPAQKIIESVRIADRKVSFKNSGYSAFKYFCGCCWKFIREANPERNEE